MFNTFKEAEAFFSNRGAYGIKPGLERVHALLDAAGNPEGGIKAIHIAGTNGKGSTASFLIDGLTANGYKTGFFTSPSFSGLTGHIFIDKKPVSEEVFVELLNRLLPAIEELDKKQMHPTEFEIITVLAMIHLAEHAEISVIEAGMGGRLDTTNCFDPILSIITNVAVDHAAFLGNTIIEIADHKAGIIKRDRPVIAGEMTEEAFAVVREVATEKKAPIFHYGDKFTVKRCNSDRFVWKSGGKEYEVALGMKGVHQMHNASLALAALVLLDEVGESINMETAVQAFANTAVPGRFEQLHSSPDIIVDGAHNPDGTKTFIDTVKNFTGKQKRHFIFSAFEDKDINQMLDLLQEEFDDITIVPFDHPRALSQDEAEGLAKERGLKWKSDWHKVMDEALSSPQDECTFITGSLNFILSVRAYILSKAN